MKNITQKLFPFIGLLLFSCSTDDLTEESIINSGSAKRPGPGSGTTVSKIWEFNDLNEWEDATQVGDPNYFLENGNLHIYTHAGTYDRTKIKSINSYTTGTYTWRVYVPAMGEGDMASIGAFLYNNDTHELDFEIGYGKQTEREALNAAADELLVYMTSQANPYQSFGSKLKREQWHTLSIELTLVNRKYFASWKIDNEALGAIPLDYGTKSKFKIFCSLENLTFMGDHIPYSDNYALFDWVEFK